MYKPEPVYRRLPAILLFMTGVCTGPPGMAEPAEVAAEPTEIIETGAPVIPGLIRRTLADPDLNYASASGPDDCSSEILYSDSRGMLGKYAVDPVANGGALKEYIMSGEAQCNCTSAIVGKDFQLLLKNLGTTIDSVPCM